MKLKDHLLARVLNKQYDAEPPTFTTKDRGELYIAEDRLEQRYSMSVYHTTHDLRRGKDRVNMRNRSHIMTLSQDGTHPYAYAQVLGIYGLDVLHGPTMSDEVRMNVLWVRWFKIDETHRAGWKAKRLYRSSTFQPLRMARLVFLTQTTSSVGPTSSAGSTSDTGHIPLVILEVYGTLRRSPTGRPTM